MALAPWKEKARLPAAFRDAKFWVEKAELGAGRKTVTFDYPQRDTSFVEDLGRKPREFSIDGYVVGPTYMTARDALLDAVEASGPGTLVHPYYGTKRVAVTGCHVEESTEEGGIARFSIQFTETIDRAFTPTAVTAPAAAVETSADGALTASRNLMLQRYATVASPNAVTATTALRGPAFSFDSVSKLLQTSSGRLHDVLAPVVSNAQRLAEFKRQTDALYGDALSLVRTPFALGTRLGDLFRSLTTLPVAPRLGVKAMLQAYDIGSLVPRPPATTATRRLERTRFDATLQHLQQVSVIQAAVFAAAAAQIVPTRVTTSTSRQTTSAPTSAAAAGGYDNYQDAIAVRDAILAQLDEQLAVAGEALYPALDQVRSDVVAALPGDTQTWPRLVTVTMPATLPSLVLAYRLYGSIALEQDLVARNRIPHAGFVRGDRELQVLADA